MRYTLFFTSSLFPFPSSVRVRLWRGLRPSVAYGLSPCSRLDAKREWGKPRQSFMV
ncbi:MAG: hypothetical protein F6K63_14215 [Moorea sp. SIO1G6]|uniref:hypothetical protein n=1 Tax=Moorena sp. SIO1G6 TaxID=2607840 RepID=UPI0013C1B8EC|nr:hypothetical protein [Moorena sp. SIO1G6]NET65471.1 hypothetical protein [Moorena sp. SIO1G6]